LAITLLLITQWFDPEPTSKGLFFARELLKRGFDVEVVTGFPNYPGGKMYPGYRIRSIQREVIDGVRVTRLPLYPSHDRSKIGRVLNYLSFSASVVIYGLLFAERPGVIYAYHPPLTVAMSAAVIRIFRRSKLLCDIQDLWPDTLRATGMVRSALLLRCVGWFCRLSYWLADKLVVQSPGFAEALVNRGAPKEKVEVILNWANEAEIDLISAELCKEPVLVSNRFVVLFAGNMGPAQALGSVIEAARLLHDSGDQVEFRFLGSGLELPSLKSLGEQFKLDNVSFVPPVPMCEVASHLAAADALLVHLKRDELFEITIPSKTQAYLLAGRPIIMAARGDAAEIVSRSGGGLIVEPEDALAIACAVRELIQLGECGRLAMARAGQNFYADELSAEVGISKFARVLRDLSRS